MTHTQKCPSCNNKSVYGQHSYYPFCSAKCRDHDFLDWHSEKKIMSTPITDADEAMDLLDSQNLN